MSTRSSTAVDALPGVVSLDDPEGRNTFSAGLIAGLVDSVERADADAGSRAVVVEGRPEPFCVGAPSVSWSTSPGTTEVATPTTSSGAELRERGAPVRIVPDQDAPRTARELARAVSGAPWASLELLKREPDGETGQ
ncbi:enoyl-CoA hydratase-related protein [Streptomyces sp. NPDC002851]